MSRNPARDLKLGSCALVLGGDHIYKIDCSIMLEEPVAKGAELSVA